MRYLFEDYTLDTDRRELQLRGEVVRVAPQAFDLLDHLIRNRDRVVTKDDLICAVWNGRAVSDAALTTRLNALRTAIGDTGEEKRIIKTVPRRGFRFVATVREDRSRAGGATGCAAQNGDTTPKRPEAPRLSIVVLPFVNLSDAAEQDYFVDGITESLTTDLSRLNGSFVIGRHTAFTYKGKAVDLKLLGRELGVRYVLRGSVQRGKDRLRLNVQLVDAETAAHIWSDRFDKKLADLFDLQDEIVSRLANALGTQLVAAEARRAAGSLNPDAMDRYFQGMAAANMGATPEYMVRAREFFQHALELDGSSVEALVGLAGVDVTLGGLYLAEDRADRLVLAETNLIDALRLAPQHAAAHMYLGAARTYTKRASKAIAEFEHALSLDRNLAAAHGWIGLAKYFLGLGAETEAHVQEALRLSPCDNAAYRWMTFVGLAKAQLGADEEAVAWLRRGIEANRNQPMLHFNCAAALARLGALDDARAAARAGLALNPEFTIDRYRAGTPSDNPIFLAGRERIYEGMRLAWVPER